VLVDALQYHRGRADERRRTGSERRRHVEMRTRDRAQNAERRDRRSGEDENLKPDGRSGDRRDRGRDGGQRDGAQEEEARREDLSYSEQQCRNRPGEPRSHDSSVGGRCNTTEPGRHLMDESRPRRATTAMIDR
jgi:hypothetical protein